MELANSNPYVGLRPFNEDENLLFFGRDKQTLELLNRLHQHRFVAVVGGSGSGKSSLIRAGLIPALKGGYLVEDSSKWLISVMKPGSNPMFNLAKSILRQIDPNATTEAISELVLQLKRERTSAILNRISPLRREKNANFFLLVDQFEELFRFSMMQKDAEKKAEAIDFVNLILNLSKQKIIPFYVVLTMRSDFIGDCAQFRNLPEAMNESQFLVPRITRQDLKKIIEGPARLFGGKIDPLLTVKLINDLGKVKDELPLLQHALMRIWDYEVNVSKNGVLDLDDYRQIGGIEKALSRHADEALSGMTKEEVNISEELFQALTAIDENGRKIRRPLLLSDLKALTGETEKKLLSIIDNFVRDRRSFLIVQSTGDSNDKLIDISHESLIRQWFILGLWVDDENRSALNYLRLVEANELHKTGEKDFLSGAELSLALAWQKEFQPTEVWANRYRDGFAGAMDYLKESENEHNRLLYLERSRRRKFRILAGAIMGLIVLFGIYAITSNISIRKQKLKLETTNNSLNQANDEIKSRAYSDSLNRVEAIYQKEIAVDALKSVDSALTVALEQRKIAIDAERLADLEASNAKEQTALAKAEKDKAQQLFEEAEALRISANEKKDAFELHFQATVLVSKDPTAALRLEEEALKLYDYPAFRKLGREIINNDALYRIVAQDSSGVTAIDRSPSGKYFIMGNDRGYIRLWDNKGNWILTTLAHRDKITSLKFSPDESGFVSSSLDRSVAVWSINGENVSRAESLQHPVLKIQFSPDGDVVTSDSNGVISFWNSDGTIERSFQAHPNQVSAFAFSHDGKQLVTGSIKTVRHWNMKGLSLIHEFTGHEGKIFEFAFSPDDKLVLAGSRDAIARLYNLKQKRLIQKYEGHLGAIISVAFSPDGQQILTGSFDNTIRLWSLNGGLVDEFIGHQSEVSGVYFSEDGKTIMSGSRDGTIRTWIREQVKKVVIETQAVNRSVRFSPDGKTFLTSTQGKAQLWNMNGTLKHEFACTGNGMVFSAVYSPDGQHVVTGSQNGTVAFWNINGEQIWEEKKYVQDGGIAAVRAIAFSPDGESFVTGSWDYWLRVWNLDGKILKESHSDYGITSVDFAPDGKSVVAGSFGKSLIWDLKNYKWKAIIEEPSRLFVNGVAFNPDNDTEILTGSNDNGARLWDLSGNRLKEFKGPRGAVRSVAISHDGETILTGTGGGIARLWDREENILAEYQNDIGTVFSVAFDTNSQSFLMASGVKIYLIKILPLEQFLREIPFEALNAEQKKRFKIND